MRRKLFMLVITFVFTTLFLTGCGNNLEEVSKTTPQYLDTELQIMIYAENEREGEEIIDEAFEEISRLEGILSRYESGSDIREVNENAGKEKVEVSPETIELLKEAKKWGEATEGHFDVSIAPLLNRWGFDDDNTYLDIGEKDDTGDLKVDFKIPDEEEIAEILDYVDYTKIEIDEEEETVYLPDERMELEVVGIAKGYVLQSAEEILLENGVEHGFLRAGGDIATIGGKPDEPWIIGVTNPRDSTSSFATLEIEDRAIGTAGDYMRYFMLDGQRYSHILDPKEGRPVDEVVSATIEAETVLEIDVISTIAMVKGVDEGIRFVENLDSVEGALVDKDGRIHYTSGFEDIVESGPEDGDKIF